MAYSISYQFFRLRFACIIGGAKRSKVVMKRDIFKSVGENIAWQPRILPADPELIILHNNITIASGVTFITHDVFRLILNNMDYNHNFDKNYGCIEIMDNVAIGAKAIILPDVRIGPNAIVGAGAVVTKDVPEGTIVAGNPAKIIGTFEELVKKMTKTNPPLNTDSRAWEAFYKKRK